MAVTKPQAPDTTQDFKDLAVANPSASATKGEVDLLRESIEKLALRTEKLEDRTSRYGEE